MKLPLIVVKITPLEWALVPFQSQLHRSKWYFLCFELTVVKR